LGWSARHTFADQFFENASGVLRPVQIERRRLVGCLLHQPSFPLVWGQADLRL